MILGHDKQIQFFQERFKSRFFHHAWILKGPRGVGKFTCALHFARDILKDENIYANLKIIAAQDEKSISVEDVRNSLDFLTQTTIEGGWKILVIDSIGSLNRHSQNTILKSLEEPRPKTLFLLILQNGEKILPTISSRCIPLNFSGIEERLISKYIQDKHENLETSKSYAELSGGSIGRLETLISKDGVKLYETMVLHMISGKISSLSGLASKHTPLFLSEMITTIYHRSILFQGNQNPYPIYETEARDLKSLMNMMDWRKVGDLFTRLHRAELLHLEPSSLFLV